MKMFYGASETGSVAEAAKGLSAPKLIIMMSNADSFEANVSELEGLYPGVPSIGCIAMGYNTKVTEKGVVLTAFTEGVTAAAGVLENVSVAPARYIERLEKDIERVKPGRDNTAIIDLCAGNDAAVMTTVSPLVKRYGLQQMGATGDAGKVACCGKIYPDGMAYALVRNDGGKVKAYKENIYTPMEGIRLIASGTDTAKYYIGELNGKSAKQVYMETLGITEADIATQTFKNPFGKIIGDDVCIISLKEVQGSGIACYRQVNDSDILTILTMRDMEQVAQETIDAIRADFSRISGVFSVNCVFRYLVFNENGNLSDYLDKMNGLGLHCGLIGYGEHYNTQFVNQTMTCVVFE